MAKAKIRDIRVFEGEEPVIEGCAARSLRRRDGRLADARHAAQAAFGDHGKNTAPEGDKILRPGNTDGRSRHMVRKAAADQDAKLQIDEYGL